EWRIAADGWIDSLDERYRWRRNQRRRSAFAVVADVARATRRRGERDVLGQRKHRTLLGGIRFGDEGQWVHINRNGKLHDSQRRQLDGDRILRYGKRGALDSNRNVYKGQRRQIDGDREPYDGQRRNFNSDGKLYDRHWRHLD